MAFDSFLKIDGVDGESTQKGHEKWVELVSFAHQLAQSGGGSKAVGGGSTGGRCDHGEFVVTKNIDKSTPKLLLHCCSGEHIKEITVHCCRATGDKSTFYEVKMSDIIVRSVRPIAESGGSYELPSEEVSFSYAKIEWNYTEYGNDGKKKGNLKTGWNVATDSKV